MIENIGKAQSRNEKFFKSFNKSKILKNVVKNESPICFDIGAFQGQSVELFISIFSNPIIYSFEALPKNFKILKSKKFKDNKCFNIAVSNFSGESIFYENKISHSSSLFKVNAKSKDSLDIQNKDSYQAADYNKEIKVLTTTLDEFYISNKLNQIHFLKIDVQGAESLVIEGGAKAFLKNTKVVMVEVSFFDYYENNNEIYNVEKILIPLGFKLFSIVDISQNPMNGRTDWAELLYVRK